jgi:hypothetical protein
VAIAQNLRRLVKLAAQPLRALRESQVALSCAAGVGSRALRRTARRDHGLIGFLALANNMTSVLLLMRYEDGDANVRSVWLCSRNDAIGNIAVVVAAFGVWGT